MTTGLRNISIRTKLAASFGVALALIVGVGVFGVYQMHTINSLTTRLSEVWIPRIAMLNDIKRATGEQRLLATRRAQTTNFRDLASIAKSMNAARDTIEKVGRAYEKTVDTPAEQALFAEFRTLWADYETTLRVIFQRIEAGEITAALQEFNSVSLAAYESAVALLDRLIEYSKQRGEAASADATRAYRLALLLAIAFIAFAAICAIAAIVWISKNISSPILRVSEAMRRLTAGDDSVTIADDPNRTDEIGVLAAATAGYRETLLRSRRLAMVAEQERGRLNAAISNMPIGLSMFDADRRLIVCNDRYGEMYQLPPELTRPGTPLLSILHARFASGHTGAERLEDYIKRVQAVIGERKPALNLVELSNGRVLSIIHQPMPGGGWVSTHEDVTERRRAEERIHHMARHDALTNLPNRTLFRERVDEALQKLGRGETVAVLSLDLDHFKAVNDTLGHPVGDLLLKQVAARLRETVREGDTIARFGGDEFSVVQVGAEQPTGSTVLAQRIIETVSAPYDLDGHQVVIGTSVGVSVAPTDGRRAEQLLKNSDMALYRAKNDGRGTYRFFEPEMDARMQSRRTLELDLRRALIQEEFEIHYQPLVKAANGEVTGFEALLRWRHPERGLVVPGKFIPLAEEIGLIVPLGEWVLRQACLDAASWPGNVRVAVNLSPAQFRSKRLLEAVVKALAISKLAPQRLELEITERVLVADSENAIATMHQLRALGVRIAMDDFGTGYSSLSYLRKFPYDKIKIDGSFVREIQREQSSLAIVRAVTGLGTSLGIVTTAEGVETEEQLERVRAEGCTEVQGFYFSEPKPAKDVARMLATLNQRTEAAA